MNRTTALYQVDYSLHSLVAGKRPRGQAWSSTITAIRVIHTRTPPFIGCDLFSYSVRIQRSGVVQRCEELCRKQPLLVLCDCSEIKRRRPGNIQFGSTNIAIETLLPDRGSENQAHLWSADFPPIGRARPASVKHRLPLVPVFVLLLSSDTTMVTHFWRMLVYGFDCGNRDRAYSAFFQYVGGNSLYCRFIQLLVTPCDNGLLISFNQFSFYCKSLGWTV